MSSDSSGISIRKKIGMASIVLMGLGVLSPMGPVTIYGPIQQMTGGHMSLAFLIALIPMIFVAYVYGIFAAEFPRAGASYTFASKGLGSYVGFITGWLFILDYCLVPLMSFLITAIYFCSIFPSVNPYLIKAVFLAVCLILNLRTIKAVEKFNNVITAFAAGIMIVFIILGFTVLSGGGAHGVATANGFYNPETFSWGTIFAGAAVCCFNFMGFDALTVLAEDVDKPRKTLPKSLILVCVIMAVFFALSGGIGQAIYPDYNSYSAFDAAMLDPMFVAGGQTLVTIVSIGMCVAMFTVMVDMMAASSRLLYAMGRDGALPRKFFGYENPKTHVPTHNVLLLAAFSAIFMWADVNVVITMITFGGLLAYTIVNLSAFRYFWFIKKDRKGAKVIGHLILPLIGFVFCGYLWLSLGTYAQIVGFSWLAVGIIYMVIKSRGFKRPMAQYAAEVEAELSKQEAADTQIQAATANN